MDTVFAPFLTGFVFSAALIMAIGAQILLALRQELRAEHVGPIVLFCGLSNSLPILLGVGGAGAFPPRRSWRRRASPFSTRTSISTRCW
jgi:L-lysine exporter family protein LysE/ArgO